MWRVDIISPTTSTPTFNASSSPIASLDHINLTTTIHPTHSPRTATTSRVISHARAYDLPNTPALIAYLHATAGYPVKSTWVQAIKHGHYTSWPGLTATLASRYCPDVDKTTMGHMAQPRQHIRSTNHTTNHDVAPPTALLLPQAESLASIAIHTIPIARIFTDDTGQFMPRSHSGNQYIMVAIHNDSNAILVRPFASKHDTHHVAAYTDVYNRLKAIQCAPTLHILDNEASTAFQ